MFVTFNPNGKTVSEVVTIVTADHFAAIEVTGKGEERILRAIRIEAELVETLRTGLSRRVRGIKK